MHSYRLFGLNIISDFPLNDLPESDSDDFDVHIINGVVPETIENALVRGPKRTVGEGTFLLNLNGVAKYYVEHGSKIIVEPYEREKSEVTELVLMGTCIGVVLYQRTIVPVHGSCVASNGSGIIISGESGAGKSTIAAAMVEAGYSLLTDDIAAVRMQDETPVVYPGYPSQKLWADAVERIGSAGSRRSLNRHINGMEKYSVTAQTAFQAEPAALNAIYEVVPAETDDVIIEKINGMDKLGILMRNAYRKVIAAEMGKEGWLFTQCATIAGKVDVYRVTRPKGKHLEREIAAAIIQSRGV